MSMKTLRYRSIRFALAFVVLAVSAAVSAGLLGACSKPKDGAGQGAAPQTAQGQGRGQSGARAGGRQMTVPVEVAAVKVGLLTTERDTAGVVTPVTQSQVAAQVAGVVMKLHHLSGDWVKNGDPIVQLDDAQLKLSVANAQAALANAEINLSVGEDNASQANPKLSLQVKSAQSALDSAQKYYESQKALYALGGISASQLDSASSQLTAAQANLEGAKTALDQNQKAGDQTLAQLKLAVTQSQNALEQAKLNYQYATIRAPFTGQIAAMNVQPGMYVGLNTAVFTLVSAAREVTFSVAPTDAPAVAIGTSLAFEYGGKKYPIRVTQAPSAPINGVVPVVGMPQGAFSLPFGAVGNVSYPVPVAQGALVPIAALATLENNNFVFLVQEGKAVTKDVSIIGEAGITAVVDGLAAGDSVIVSPPPGLLPGSPVQVVLGAADSTSGGRGAPTAAAPQGSRSGAPADARSGGAQTRTARPGAAQPAPAGKP